MEITLSRLAEFLGGTPVGNPDILLRNVAKIEDAASGEITFVANPKYEKYLDETKASAVIVSDKLEVHRTDIGLIRLPDPYFGFVKALQFFNPPKDLLPAGIHEKSVIASTAQIGNDVRIGACAVIGEHARIGNRTIICSGVFIGDDAVIGDDCIIYPNVTIYWQCRIGNNVIIHSGTTIGSDGFGFAPKGDRYEKIPQMGIVVIEDDVEIGSNCSIDRATIGMTRIRRGVKIDNLVQVAHNVDVGEDSIIVSQSGVSGSTTLGKHVVLAGQVGVVGHIEIADHVTVTAQSGVSKSLTGKGKVYRGSPANDFREEMRVMAATRQIPELIKTVQSLQKKIEELEKELSKKKS